MVNSSIPRPTRRARDAGPRARDVLLVALGGALGTLLRAGLGRLMPTEDGQWAWSTLIVNLLGAFLLPLLLGVIATLRRRLVAWRLLLGTGFFGGFTTYSAFATQTLDLARGGHLLLALAYAEVSLVGGLVLALVAVWLTERRWRR